MWFFKRKKKRKRQVSDPSVPKSKPYELKNRINQDYLNVWATHAAVNDSIHSKSHHDHSRRQNHDHSSHHSNHFSSYGNSNYGNSVDSGFSGGSDCSGGSD